VRDQRGLSLLELLIAAALATVVAGGLFSAYVATARSFGESGAQTALQRQGALVLEEIGRQVRGADGRNPLAIGSCNGVAGSLLVRTTADSLCYYARADGALCEVRGIACRNLLAGGLKKITLLRQPATPDPRCPAGADGNPMPAGALCFTMAPVASDAGPPLRVDLAFAIRDGDLDSDLDGVNAMAFSISLTCSGRNC
jgi:Tfp pilus assembly protein PilW